MATINLKKAGDSYTEKSGSAGTVKLKKLKSGGVEEKRSPPEGLSLPSISAASAGAQAGSQAGNTKNPTAPAESSGEGKKSDSGTVKLKKLLPGLSLPTVEAGAEAGAGASEGKNQTAVRAGVFGGGGAGTVYLDRQFNGTRRQTAAEREAAKPTWADWGELAKQTALAGLGQMSRAAGATLSAAEQAVTRPLGWLLENPDLYKDGVFYNINQNAAQEADKIQENLSQAAEKTGKAGELIAQFGPATIAALPQAALAYLTAGQSMAAQASTAGLQAASTAAQLTGGAAVANTALETVKSMASNPSFQYSFLNTVGGEYEQALEDGADVKTAYAYATLTALINSVVEIGGEGGIDQLPEGDKHLLLEWVKDMFDEGKEEVIQGAISQMMQNAAYQKGNPLFSMTDGNAIVNPGRMAEDFAGGAVVGGILGGGQLALQSAVNGRAQKGNIEPEGLSLPMPENGGEAMEALPAVSETSSENAARERSGLELPGISDSSGSTETAAGPEGGVQYQTGTQDQTAANGPENGIETLSVPMQENEERIARQLTQEREEPPNNQNGGTGNGTEQFTGPATAEAGEYAGGEAADTVSDGSEGRNAGERTGGQAGRVVRGAGASTALKQSGAAIERQNTARSLRLERVSSRSLGIENGTDRLSLRTMPQASWDSEMQTAADYIRSTSGLETVYVLGGIEVERSDGGISRARGAILPDKSVIIQADHTRLSVTQIADHELYHNLARETPGLNADVEQKILETYGQEEFDRVLETYIQKQMGIIDVMDDMAGAALDEAMDRIKEEIFADAYAGINAFGAGADRFAETVNRAAEDRGGRLSRTYSEATDRTTGPPEGLRLPGPEDFRDTGTSSGNIPGDNDTDVRFSLDEDQEDVTQPEADRQEEKEESRTADQTKRKPVKESRPIIAKQDLRKGLTSLFSIPEGQRAEIGKIVDSYADRLIKNGALTEADRTELFDRLYESGVVTVPADQYYQMGLQAVAGGRIYVNDQIRGDFGDDWNDFRKRAFASGVYLTGDSGDAGVDVWNGELAEMLPGLFDGEELDGRTALERIIQVAEEGGDEKMSLPEYTAMTAQQEYIPESELLDNMERQMDWMLRSFADKADLEVKLRDRTGVKIAQERERASEGRQRMREREAARRAAEQAKRAETVQRQKANRELRELQNRTLKQLRWLNQNRSKAPADLRTAFDEVLGDIDLFAVSAANEMNWSKKYQATWKDLAEMYQNARRTDPNFLPSAELERIVTRLSADKIGEMDVSALQDLYKAAVGLRTEYYNRKNVINDEQGRLFSQVYDGAKQEIESAPGGARLGKESYDMGKAEKFLNMEQLTPINYLERMGGWNPDGEFYSMAKQLERGERDMRRYRVQAESLLEDFLTKNADWVKRSDGQGKDAIWHEIEVPELLELGMGDKPVFGDNIKVYMTPAQKVHMYLESRNYDNLRHMAGGRTFADKELYAKGKRQEAFAQGKTVRLAPETVKEIVSDLTPEEMELAKVLDGYYNQFAAEQINRKSNVLYGYDKAMSGSYAPIYSNQNYVKSEIGIFDATAEGVGNLKARQYSGNPSYNISALDAFERHVDQTSRFVGMAIPARNWQTLLNWREKNNSMGDVITHKWGKESKQYIEDLLTTLQGGGVTGKKTLDGLADTMLSNYVTGVFGANPGIVLKQAASFPQFAAALGWRNLPRAFAKADESIINTYTSELAYRTLGYATPETAQLKNNPNWMDTNKVTRFLFRGGAITAMDAATVKRAWPWAEAKVSREHPELEVGTREQIEAGESPFYKKVAEEFENAVSLTQPMYDEMHRPDIMKNGGSIQRAFTMFKTVPLQQYNTLRRTIGEARQAARQVKSAEGAEAKRQAQANAKAAAQTAGAAVTATLASTLMLEGIEFLNQLWKNMGKGYRDDDDELTAESVAQQMARNAAGDLTGMVIGGGELTDIIASKLLDETWWGIEIPGGEQLNEVIESIQSAADTIETIAGGAAEIVTGGGDLKEYFRRNAGDYAGAAKEIAEKAAMYLGGLPVENIEKYIMGALQIASPELWEGAQSTFDTPEKGDMAGLSGAALTARAGSVLRTRGLDVEDETAAALAALYEAGYAAAIPSDTPGSVTVNGESRKLNAYQKQTYDLVWSGTLAGCMDDLIASGEFQNKNKETQAKILARLYSYAGEKAKEALFDDYEISSSALQADAVVRAGGSPEEWAAWATAPVAEPDEDKNEGEERRRKLQELRDSVWGDEVKLTAVGTMIGTEMETEQGNPTQWAKVNKAIDDGCSVERAIDLILDGDLDYYIKWMESDARTVGVPAEIYIEFRNAIKSLTGDKDDEGNTISGSKRKKVLDCINSLPISNAFKDALYYEAGYSKSGIYDVPW